MSKLAHNRKRPRARTWTLEALDRGTTYTLQFDPEAFRWEVRDAESGERVVTRNSINRRSRWDGDRVAGGPPERLGGDAGAPSAPPDLRLAGRHRADVAG